MFGKCEYEWIMGSVHFDVTNTYFKNKKMQDHTIRILLLNITKQSKWLNNILPVFISDYVNYNIFMDISHDCYVSARQY